MEQSNQKIASIWHKTGRQTTSRNTETTRKYNEGDEAKVRVKLYAEANKDKSVVAVFTLKKTGDS